MHSLATPYWLAVLVVRGGGKDVGWIDRDPERLCEAWAHAPVRGEPALTPLPFGFGSGRSCSARPSRRGRPRQTPSSSTGWPITRRNIGNGTCSVGGAMPRCTLRAAIQEANNIVGRRHDPIQPRRHDRPHWGPAADQSAGDHRRHYRQPVLAGYSRPTRPSSRSTAMGSVVSLSICSPAARGAPIRGLCLEPRRPDAIRVAGIVEQRHRRQLPGTNPAGHRGGSGQLERRRHRDLGGSRTTTASA